MELRIILVSWVTFFLAIGSLCGQGNFYNIEKVREIKMEFVEDNWAQLLDELYVAGEGDRLTGTLYINGERLDSVGVRYKGFSSVSVERQKNPFNIKIDHVINQDYKGIDKIKLGNCIHDPSFVREALSYEIARKYMPASEANFAEVYVNEVYLGLYSNVEAVDFNFVDKHFDSDDNAFFKGSPDELDFDGENSNLSLTPGLDTSAYKPYYDKESKDGWEELLNFIQVLNENPDRIEDYLNVDRALWMHAFNYVLVNLDSYIGYAQNYYLYKDDLGDFNTIPWDLNMSFGSYRITDASDNFDGVSIGAAKSLDPLAHYNSVSVFPRPLMRKLFENDRYRRMYLAHIKTIVEENISNGLYYQRAQEIQADIMESVVNDLNKFYTTQGFTDNLTQTYTDNIQYPGLTDLMDARSDYLLSLPALSEGVTVEPLDPLTAAKVGERAEITCKTEKAVRAFVSYRFSEKEKFVTEEMTQFSTDWWVLPVTMEATALEYYFYAENDIVGAFSPARAATDTYIIWPEVEGKLNYNDLVINEVMASNNTTAADEAEQYDDWIEIYNTTSQAINLDGLFVSDKEDVFNKWAMPDTIIGPDSYMIVWADEDGGQGEMHANFKLSAGGEFISISYSDGTIMDSITFGEQITDQSFGRLPNGTGPFVALTPSFSGVNSTVKTKEVLADEAINVYPNPVSSLLNIDLRELSAVQLQLYDSAGKLLFTKQVNSKMTTINLDGYPAGNYTLSFSTANTQLSKTIIKR